MKIVYTQKAQQDIMNIYDYVAFTLLVPEIAQKLTDSIMASIRTLASIPERNPLYKKEPWYSRGVRFLPVKNYLIFYTVNIERDMVLITRIMYSGRNIEHQYIEFDL